MIIDALYTPRKAEERSWQMLFLGFFYASIAMWLGYTISPKHSSLMMIFFTALACVPIIYNTIKFEEEKDEKGGGELFLLKEHSKALKVFIFLFIGMTIAFSFWNMFLPVFVEDKVVSMLFSAQSDTIQGINGKATDIGNFFTIFFNNIEVMFWCLAFSFMFGFGAIFILTWNASVIGVAIARFVEIGISKMISETGTINSAGYAKVYSCAYLVRYLPHGIPEILAYFTAGLAGGIISVAIIRHKAGTKRFMDIIFDSADLLLISFLIIFIAGIIEVWITPGLVTGFC